MSTVHGDFRILSHCYSSFECLAGSELPFAQIYYQEGQLRREILSEDSFQNLVYSFLNKIGDSFLIAVKTTQLVVEANPKVSKNQEEKISISISGTIRLIAQSKIRNLERRLFKRSSAINRMIQARIKRIKEGEVFLHSYLGENIFFKSSYLRGDIEDWKRKHLEKIFSIELRGQFPTPRQLENLVRQKFSMEDKQQLKYWDEKVEKGSFRMVKYPDVGDVVCYLDCSPFVEGVVDESGRIDVNGTLHTLFEKKEYGRRAVFLRRKTPPSLKDFST